MNKSVSVIMFALFLPSTLALSFSTEQVRIASTTIIVPNDYSTIQEAIEAANPGDTIFVFNGTYLEHVVVNKTVSLLGENRTTTIIDGQGNGTVVSVIAENVTISGFTIRNSGEKFVYGEPAIWCGIMVGGYESYINYTTISNNTIKDNYIGVFFYDSCNGALISNDIENNTNGVWLMGLWMDVSNNTVSNNGVGLVAAWLGWSNISGNVIASNGGGLGIDDSISIIIDGNRVENNIRGIHVSESVDIAIRRNDMTANRYGFGVFGDSLSSYMHDIDPSNTVNGKPVYYLINQNNLTIDSSTFPDVGYLGIVNSTKVKVKDLNLTNSSQGLLLAGVTDSSITNVHASDNKFGIHLAYSHNNTLNGVTIANSLNNSIYLESAHNNTFYHNNFINNTKETYLYKSFDNRWDNGYPLGGNYWSNYLGADLRRGSHQNEPGSDGLGDTAHVLDASNEDTYPLMGPFGPLTGKGVNITVFPADEVGLIFENVTTEGLSTANETNVGPDPPSGFKIDQYYNIETTAYYSDAMMVRIVYDDSNMTLEEEETLQLMQWNDTEQRWVNVTAYADTEYNVVIGETSHLSIFGVTRQMLTNYIAITEVTLSRTVVGQGYSLTINVTIWNQGDSLHTFNTTVYANTSVIETRNVTLAGGMYTTVTFTWNTSGFTTGNYTLTAYASSILNETAISDNTFIADKEICVTIPGDVDGDRDVDIFDIVMMAGIYGSQQGDPEFIVNCDINSDGDVDIFDIVIACGHYGENW